MKKPMICIFIGLNLLGLAIDPILGGVFFLMWIGWFKNHEDELEV